MWDAPGAWADLRKSNGAYGTGLNAQARLVLPTTAADQYAEITYDQAPGAASWVGVMTRVQGAANGSGYLAIAYADEVRLYRTDDSGVLNFTLLAAASANLSVAPRRLRLESEGNTHPVYFNGSLADQSQCHRDRLFRRSTGHCRLSLWRTTSQDPVVRGRKSQRRFV